MSIRTNPMKAVPTLLKRLVTAEKHADLNDLKSELIKIKDLFSMVKKNEDELLDTLTVVDGYLRNSNIRKLMEEKEEICKRIRISTQKLLPAGSIQSAAGSSEKTIQDVKIDEIQEMNRAIPSSPQLEDLEMLKVNYNNLHYLDRRFFHLLLLLRPENAVMRKRDIFGRYYYFSGYFRDSLVNSKLIVPHGKCPVVSKYKINPWVSHKSVRSLLQNYEDDHFATYSQIITSSHHGSKPALVLDQQKVKLSDGFGFKSTQWRVVYNAGASYLNFGPQWMAKMNDMLVLDLGRWLQDSPKHHIEVQSEEFLKELGHQKHLWYLNLRGISGISKLPPSIVQLESLKVLDLKACHNLETLPNDIASLRNLTHLYLSQCYLLDRMPKGIEKLTELRVLKGFLIGSSGKTPCRISDLANLKKLERLSIHIGTEAVIQDGEFESLNDLSALGHLKISWGVSDTRDSDIQVILPSSLKKLHLEGFPGQEIPEWLKPSELLQGLKVLYITGGKLKSMNHRENNNHWCVEIVRLRYLKHLKVDLKNLQELFPLLRYAEIKQVLNHSYFEWSIDSRGS